MTQRIASVRQHPKIPVYKNTGDGRDTYISFYNGGFGNYRLNDTYLKERKESSQHIYHQNLSLCKPTKKYFTDGGGRDTYVYNSLLDENDKFKGNLRLNNILRSYDPINYPLRSSRNISPSIFEKKLINRIFYGKCPGVKDRQMSPKVKFLKKNDLIKSKDTSFDNESEKSLSFLETRNGKNLDLEDKKDNIHDISSHNDNENNVNNTQSKTGIEFNKNLYQLKKNSRKYRSEVEQNDNLVDSVKKIFLYNNFKSNNQLQNKNNIKKVDIKYNSRLRGSLSQM